MTTTLQTKLCERLQEIDDEYERKRRTISPTTALLDDEGKTVYVTHYKKDQRALVPVRSPALRSNPRLAELRDQRYEDKRDALKSYWRIAAQVQEEREREEAELARTHLMAHEQALAVVQE